MLIIALLSILNHESQLLTISEANWVLPKRNASPITYLVKDGTWYWLESDQQGKMPLEYKGIGGLGKYITRQSGDHLVRILRDGQPKCLIYKRDKLITSIDLNISADFGFVEYLDQQLYLGYLTGSELFILKLGKNGEVLKEHQQNEAIKQRNYTRRRVFSCLHENQILLYVPQSNSISHFSKTLTLEKRYQLKGHPQNIAAFDNSFLGELSRLERGSATEEVIKNFVQTNKGRTDYVEAMNLIIYKNQPTVLFCTGTVTDYVERKQEEPDLFNNRASPYETTMNTQIIPFKDDHMVSTHTLPGRIRGMFQDGQFVTVVYQGDQAKWRVVP